MGARPHKGIRRWFRRTVHNVHTTIAPPPPSPWEDSGRSTENDRNSASCCTDKGVVYAPPDQTQDLAQGWAHKQFKCTIPRRRPTLPIGWVLRQCLAANHDPAPNHSKNLIFMENQTESPNPMVPTVGETTRSLVSDKGVALGREGKGWGGGYTDAGR